MVIQYALAIHIGAGLHARSKEAQYKNLMQSTLKYVQQLIKDKEPHTLDETLLVEAITKLEDSPLTNSGLGSNLTRLKRRVECDACIMRSDGKWASIGAARGIKNPIRGVYWLLKRQHPFLVEPLMLTGLGLWRKIIYECQLDKDMAATSTKVTETTKKVYDPIEIKNSTEASETEPISNPLNTMNSKLSRDTSCINDNNHNLTSIGSDTTCISSEDHQNSNIEVQHEAQHRAQQEVLEEECTIPSNISSNCYRISCGSIDVELCKEKKQLNSYLINETSMNRWKAMHEKLYDTVGAVLMVWDDNKEHVSLHDNRKRRRVMNHHSKCLGDEALNRPSFNVGGVSSGGISWKVEGRVGEAAIAGSGCYANENSVVSCTGCGEDIMLSFTAKELAQGLNREKSNQEAFTDILLTRHKSHQDYMTISKSQLSQPRALLGALALHRELDKNKNPRVKLLFGHTSWSMGVGFVSSYSDEIFVTISRQNESSVGKDLDYSEITISG